jgi:murein DD-endopeptidase MepM/ murein hydrolase activator NlpD
LHPWATSTSAPAAPDLGHVHQRPDRAGTTGKCAKRSVVHKRLLSTASATTNAAQRNPSIQAGEVNLLLALLLMISTLTTAAEGAEKTERTEKTAYTWPLPEIRVTRRFDPPPQPWLPGHRGVDLAGHPGEEVTAAAEGTVSFAGTVAGRGVVGIVHADGIKTTYEPVSPSVHAGDEVRSGERIGVLEAGHEGCPVQACLHWGAKRGEVYVDPIRLLRLGKIRLKAVEAAPRPAAPRQRTIRRSARRPAAARRRRRD